MNNNILNAGRSDHHDCRLGTWSTAGLPRPPCRSDRASHYLWPDAIDRSRLASSVQNAQYSAHFRVGTLGRSTRVYTLTRTRRRPEHNNDRCVLYTATRNNFWHITIYWYLERWRVRLPAAVVDEWPWKYTSLNQRKNCQKLYTYQNERISRYQPGVSNNITGRTLNVERLFSAPVAAAVSRKRERPGRGAVGVRGARVGRRWRGAPPPNDFTVSAAAVAPRFTTADADVTIQWPRTRFIARRVGWYVRFDDGITHAHS